MTGSLSGWPTITDDTGTKRDGTVFNKAFFDTIRASVEAAIFGGAVAQVVDSLAVGYAGPAASGQIRIGDDNLRLDFFSGTTPRLQFDSLDMLNYDRGANIFNFLIGSTTRMQVTTSGVVIPDAANGLSVGFASTPGAKVVLVGDATFGLDYSSGNPQVTFDTNDYFQYNRGSNFFHWVIAAVEEMLVDSNGLQITNGLVVGYAGAPADDEIRVGASTFGLAYNAGNTQLKFNGTNNMIAFDNAGSSLSVTCGGLNAGKFTGVGMAFVKGGDVTSAANITPTGNVFHVIGATNITSMSNGAFYTGMIVTIIFDVAINFTDGSNLKLASTMATTADDTITLVSDGTNWYEMCRSVN